LGYLWGSSALLYVTGGVAWEQVATNATISANTAAGVFGQSAIGSFSSVNTGYVVGGGLEWMATANVILRGEYLFYGFNRSSTNAVNIANCAVAGCGVNVTTSSNNVNVVRLGASYKF
jgi:outer membrane immunogenic protein